MSDTIKNGESIISPAPVASKTVVLIIATMSSFLAPFTSSSINIALPSIGNMLSLNAVTLSWVSTAYLLAGAMFLVPVGRIADIYGRKRIFQYGIIVDFVASILCATANSGTWLIIFRTLQGLGSSMIFGTGVAILSSVFPATERGKVLGINSAAVYSGLSVGPIIGGTLMRYFDWRGVFLLNAALGLVITVLVIGKLKGEWAGARGEKIDYTGSVIFSLSLFALIYAFSVLPAAWGIGLMIASIIGFVAFVRWEMQQQFPVINVNLFRNSPVFAFSNLAALVNYSATYSVSFLFSLYLQYIKGFSPERAGIIMLAQPVMQVVFAPISGSLSDRIEPRIVASTGMALTTVSLVMLAFVNMNSSLLFILISLVILGIGLGSFTSPNTNAIMGSVEKKFYGVAAGMLATMRMTGQTLSMGLALLLFALYIGRVQITPEYYPLFLKSMKTAFTISAALCFVGIFTSIARGKTHQ